MDIEYRFFMLLSRIDLPKDSTPCEELARLVRPCWITWKVLAAAICNFNKISKGDNISIRRRLTLMSCKLFWMIWYSVCRYNWLFTLIGGIASSTVANHFPFLVKQIIVKVGGQQRSAIQAFIRHSATSLSRKSYTKNLKLSFSP